MTTYTVDSENNITAHAGLPAGADESQSFRNQKELAALTTDWPVSRMVDIWNSFAGVAPFDDLTPVKKFINREIAVARIYRAVERLSPNVAEPAADVASAKAAANDTPKPNRLSLCSSPSVIAYPEQLKPCKDHHGVATTR